MIKKIILGLFFAAVLFLGVLLCVNYWVEISAKNRIFNDIANVPKNKVGLLLGTSKKLQNGYTNLYFTYRVEAAVALFKAGKIDFVLVSGDNSRKTYDEPSDFKAELIKRGVPEQNIVLDYAGFRTLDSVVRAKKVFGQDSITIISQQFHNERAIYLADHYAINAVGFNAKDVSVKYGLKTKVREYFARAKVFWDIVLGVQPKFLGEKVEVR
ncbi:MAG: ElyC/SanA/YdcF family protein [Chitinophagales bacterium]|nr:YdcF family protein [Bacteroidota bacterium]MCB9044374.1 YdcF family protein [Chitinophagales bacterium]